MLHTRLVAALIFICLISCTSSERPTIDFEFREGSAGLVMALVPNAPPEEVYEDSELLLGYDLSNQGATDIEEGVFALSTDADFVKVIDWNGWLLEQKVSGEKTAGFAIQGKSQSLPDGDKHRMTIRAQTGILDAQTETRTQQIILTACYPYQTILAHEVCIDPDPLNTRVEKLCKTEDTSLTDQGAPVAVTKIESLMLMDDTEGVIRPQLVLTLKNTGKGQLFTKGLQREACSSEELARAQLGQLNVEARLAGKRMSCAPTPVRLKDGTGKVRCTLDSLDQTTPAMLASLVVQLDYVYSESIASSVIIRRIRNP